MATIVIDDIEIKTFMRHLETLQDTVNKKKEELARAQETLTSMRELLTLLSNATYKL